MTCHQKNLLKNITTKVRGRKARVLGFRGKLHDGKEGDMFAIKERTKKRGRQMKNHRTAGIKMGNSPTFNSE